MITIETLEKIGPFVTVLGFAVILICLIAIVIVPIAAYQNHVNKNQDETESTN